MFNKACIIEKENESDWRRNIWDGIQEGLEYCGFRVDRYRATEFKKALGGSYDLLFQWANKDKQRERCQMLKRTNNKLVPVMVEHGWFSRTENVNLMPKGKRLPLNRLNDSDKYIKNLKRVPKKWIILGQVMGDESLKECGNYIGWVRSTYKKLKTLTDKDVVYRPHPLGKDIKGIPTSGKKELEKDFSTAAGVITWNSSSALKAMLQGIPTIVCGDFEELEGWVFKVLSQDNVKTCEDCLEMNYKGICDRLAGQQLSASELKYFNYLKIVA